MTVVAVLAGGRGSRLGGGKPSALLAGRPLISYPVSAALATGLTVVVIAKPSTPLPQIDLRASVVREPEHPHHPLVGLLAALQRYERVLAIGCDMPFVSADLMSAFAALDPGPVAFTLDGRLAPFPSLHTAAEIPVLRAALARQAPLRAAFTEAGVTVLPESELTLFGDPQRLLTSVNTPDQLVAAAAGFD